MSPKQFDTWLAYYADEPFDHLMHRNQLAAILVSLTGNKFEQCGGVRERRETDTEGIKTSIRQYFSRFPQRGD